jgi:hypothetical protein
MNHLGTMTRNTMRMPLAHKHRFSFSPNPRRFRRRRSGCSASTRSVFSNRTSAIPELASRIKTLHHPVIKTSD